MIFWTEVEIICAYFCALCAQKTRNMRTKNAQYAHQKRATCAPESRNMRTKNAQHAHKNRAACAQNRAACAPNRAQLEKLEKLEKLDFFFGGKNADFKLSGLVQAAVDALASALRGCYICTYERVESRSNYG